MMELIRGGMIMVLMVYLIKGRHFYDLACNGVKLYKLTYEKTDNG